MLRNTTVLRRFAAVFSVFAVVALALSSLTGLTTAQATASLTLEPGSSSIQEGNQFSVTIYTNSGGEGVNAVSAFLTYDTSKLDFVNILASGSAYGMEVQSHGGGGTVEATRFIAPGAPAVTGKAKVVTVVFKAKAGSGSTNINFGASSTIASASSNQNIWNGNTSGGTYSFTSASSGGGGGGGFGAPSDTGGGSGGSGEDNNSGGNNNTGDDNNNSGNNNGGGQPSGGSTGGSSGNNGGSNQPPAEENETRTYMVAIKVVDNTDQPVENATVKIGNEEAKSDPTGIASFFNIEAGVHDVEIKSKAGVLSTTINVLSDVAPTEVQIFDLRVEPAERPAWLTVALGIVIVGTVGFAAFVGINRFLNSRPRTPTHSGPTNTPSPPTSSPLDNISGPATPPPGSVINAGQ